MSEVYNQIEGAQSVLSLQMEDLLIAALQKRELPTEDDPPSTQLDVTDDAPPQTTLQEEGLARALLAHAPLSAADAARLALEILESSHEYDLSNTGEVMSHCRHVIKLGIESYAREKRTLPFGCVIDALILNKAHRRKRTIAEIKQYGERIMRHTPSWRIRPLCSINAEDCQHIISECFETSSMQRKAHVILHGVFNFGMRRGWCSHNPITLLNAPHLCEKRICALTLRELSRLLRTSLEPKHRSCAPALGFLLWAGIRPTEIERITWSHVHLKDKVIEIPPQHSKTGGHRQVTIYPALHTWLRRVCTYTLPGSAIIPRAWDRRWRELRRSAGFTEWQADILRHTFASYHLKHFRDLSSLQLDMGHASSSLLRTRYIALDGITTRTAREFWNNLAYIDLRSSQPAS